MKPPRLLQVLPGAVATSNLWLSAAGLFTVYISAAHQLRVDLWQVRSHRGGPAFFDVTALIFIFGVELNANLHSMVIIM
jgi:uncharacterized BrkB/YihY/UPF0761 family membrane protein